MTTVELIEKVLTANVLIAEMTYIPAKGATPDEISLVAKRLPRALSAAHRAILERWDGLNLDVLRLYGVAPTPRELQGLADSQDGSLATKQGFIVFGDDPSGFVYAEDEAGEIWSFDSAGGEEKIIASDMDDFFQRLIFGQDAATFGGDDWADELRGAGLIS